MASQGMGQDLIVLKNGDRINGEIKTLRESVLVIETPYSDSDFNIEWDGIEQIISPREFLIYLSSKERIFASFNSSGKRSHVILSSGGTFIREVVLLKELNKEQIQLNQIDFFFLHHVCRFV